MSQLDNSTESMAPVEINYADTTWILVSTALIFLMFPGLGFFYGGITHKKTFLTQLFATSLGLAVVTVQWYLIGYSLTFSQTGSVFIGNFDHAVLLNMNTPHPNAPKLPTNLFMMFNCLFAAITPCIAFGGAAERTTLPAYLIFLVAWSTLVYDFIAYWTWSPHGWLRTFGVLDFAGGTPVHIASGFSAMAYALAVGPRKTVDFKSHKVSSVNDVYFGTVLLWFGWMGFNGGSELAINARAVNAVVTTHITACVSGLTWMITDMIYNRKLTMSLNSFCTGVVAGLVTITPAAGFIAIHYTFVFGITAGVICFFACFIKHLTNFKYDDACDVLGVHGVGGIIGCLLTGIFAENSIVTMSSDASLPNGKAGWVDGNFYQIVPQLVSCLVASTWSFVFTFIIFFVIGHIPCIRLKITEQEEHIGSDWIEIGEIAYGHNADLPKKEDLKNLKVKESNLSILRGYLKKKEADSVVHPI